MKVTIDLDDEYSEILSFAAIGHSNGIMCNVFTTTIELFKSADWVHVSETMPNGERKLSIVPASEVDP